MGSQSGGELLKGAKQSYFAKRLASDAELAARCAAVVTELRNAANQELKAVERSEQLTSEDFTIYINARADSTVPERE